MFHSIAGTQAQDSFDPKKPATPLVAGIEVVGGPRGVMNSPSWVSADILPETNLLHRGT